MADLLVDAQAKEAGWPKPEREFRYVPSRRFRADYAFVAQRVLVEIQGGVYMRRSGHSGVSGILRDIERGNLATAYGYKLIRLTHKQLQQGALTGWLQMLSLNEAIEKAEAA